MDPTLSRRAALKLGGVAAVLAAAGISRGGHCHAEATADGNGLGEAFKDGAYVLPPLPYAADALEPACDARTMAIHHDKHHTGYVRGLNTTLAKLEAARTEGDFSQIKALSRALAFHGSGHVLHTLFWRSMTPGGSSPSEALAEAAEKDFRSLAAMQAQFAAATKAVEGSGWGALVYEPIARKLLILQAEKHQDLALWGAVPLLVCDVWEHAYYLNYQNNRGVWVDAFMQVADWGFASSIFSQACG